ILELHVAEGRAVEGASGEKWRLDRGRRVKDRGGCICPGRIVESNLPPRRRVRRGRFGPALEKFPCRIRGEERGRFRNAAEPRHPPEEENQKQPRASNPAQPEPNQLFRMFPSVWHYHAERMEDRHSASEILETRFMWLTFEISNCGP